uniref:Fibrinogen C-terminal domain-containing protein n=1 Tax=Anopheles atroparvus TaxID=41427 RepID=A0A182JAX4_ANOAO
MRALEWFTVSCFAVLSLLRPSEASGFGMELLLAKQDFLQFDLQETKHAQANRDEGIVRSLSLLQADSKRLLELLEVFSKRTLSSCRDEPSKVSGKYMLQLGLNKKPFEVFCEQNSFGGGWTVIQRRFNGKENFYRGWAEYRDGFGSIGGEFWLGLEHLHEMTSLRPHELMVEIRDFDGNYGYAHYKEFRIGSEVDQYIMAQLGEYNGTAGDSMWACRREKFTTYDRDNDRYPELNCAVDRQGAWWYWKCSPSNLNGRYINGRASMHWKDFRNDWRELSYSRMMIREIKS